MGNIGIVAHDVQLAQALRADDLIFAVDEHLGAQVHFLAAFGTGIVHIVVLIAYNVYLDEKLQKPCRLSRKRAEGFSKKTGLLAFFKKNA